MRGVLTVGADRGVSSPPAAYDSATLRTGTPPASQGVLPKYLPLKGVAIESVIQQSFAWLFATNKSGQTIDKGQEKAEYEDLTHKQMLVRNETLGIHHAGGFGLIYSALRVPTVPLPPQRKAGFLPTGVGQ